MTAKNLCSGKIGRNNKNQDKEYRQRSYIDAFVAARSHSNVQKATIWCN